MNRARRPLLFLPILVAVIVSGALCGQTCARSPKSLDNASTDSFAVWIALLKGFSGDVVYVGSDDAHAYFRIGRSYYKVPTCAAKLPETFAVGSGTPYVVKLHVEHGEIRVVSDCARSEGYALGRLDRK